MWPFNKNKPASNAPAQPGPDDIDLDADGSPFDQAAAVKRAAPGSGGVGDPARPWRAPSERWTVDDVKHAAWTLADFVTGKSESELCDLWGSSMPGGHDMDLGEQNWGPQDLPALELIPDCYNLSVSFSNGVADSLVLSLLEQPWGDTCSVMFQRGRPASLHVFTATRAETAARWKAELDDRLAEAARDDERREARKQQARQEELHRQQMAAARQAAPREYSWVCRHCGLNVRAAARPSDYTGKCVRASHDWDRY